MGYCAQADIEKLIPELELTELTAESGDTPDADVVTECIAKADAEIDSYLGVKYALPLTVTPARIKSLSEDIAIYYLYTRRSVAPELRQRNYDNAVAFFKLLVTGQATLVDNDGGGEVSGGGSQTPQLYSAASVFDRNNMTGF